MLTGSVPVMALKSLSRLSQIWLGRGNEGLAIQRGNQEKKKKKRGVDMSSGEVQRVLELHLPGCNVNT